MKKKINNLFGRKQKSAGFLQVLENPRISGNNFPGLKSLRILMQVLESPGNLNLAASFEPDDISLKMVKFVANSEIF